MSRQQSEASGRLETNRELKERKQREAAARQANVAHERTKAHRLSRCEEHGTKVRKPRRKKVEA